MRLEDGLGNLITVTVEFVASQRGWFYSIEYPGWTGVSRRRLVASPNMLRQFRGVIPFGISCNVSDGQEPINKDDFTSGRVQIYILNTAEDIAEMESFIKS